MLLLGKNKLLLSVFVLVYVLFFSSQAIYSEEIKDSQTWNQSNQVQKNLSQNSQTSEKNLTTESEKQNNFNFNLDKSQVESMSVSELLKALQTQAENLKLQVITLTYSSQNLTSELNSMSLQLDNSLKNLEELKKALESNKEDTSTAITELGELQVKLDKLTEVLGLYKEEYTKATKTVNYLLPATFISGGLAATGGFLLYQGIKDKSDTLTKVGATCLGIGTAGLIGVELVWNLGRVKPKLILSF